MLPKLYLSFLLMMWLPSPSSAFKFATLLVHTQIVSSTVDCTKQYRAILPAKELHKLRSECVRGLNKKFKLLPSDSRSGINIGEVYSIRIRTQELKASLVQFECHDVFNIYKMTARVPDPAVEAKNLFTH